MRIIVLTLIGASLLLFSCKSKSQAMGSTSIESTSSNKVNANPDTHSIVVSFASKGEGIDREKRKKLDDVVSNFEQENNTVVNLEKYGWGREGEVDYLFNLENLSTKLKKDLKAKVKAAIGDSELIFISYDTKSVHKR